MRPGSFRSALPIVLFALLGLSLGDECLAQNQSQAPPSQATQQTQQDNNVELQYARTYLKLAQLDLERAQGTNRRISGTVTPAIIDQLSSTVSQAEARVKALEKHPNAAEANLTAIEVSSRLSAQRLKRAEEANRRAPGAFPQAQLDRMRVANELATLRVERSKMLRNASPEVQLAWEVEQLREEMNELRAMVMLLRERN